MIECVPNVSEGRDLAVIGKIADAIEQAGCHLLDVHSDGDHHRSVFTMVGRRDQVIDGAIALTQSAIALIDLSKHRGIHPRIGSVDVIPFIPLDETPMSVCIDAAQHIGDILGKRFNLPVLLYGEAAREKDRSSLPWIRRGGLQALSTKLKTHGSDYGPMQPHRTAGAVAVGARPFLVAFNVVLTTSDVTIAETIASELRESNGGLPGVKGLGLALHSRQLTQVSMNLTRVPQHRGDPSATTVPAAFRAVRVAAQRFGVDVLESEIVGLAPRMALADATADDLLMCDDPRHRILETRITEVLP